MRILTGIFALILLASTALSQGTWENGRACAEDRARFCADVQPGDGRVAGCLRNHQIELSEVCRRAIFNLNLTSSSAQELPPQMETNSARVIASELKQSYDEISQAVADRDA